MDRGLSSLSKWGGWSLISDNTVLWVHYDERTLTDYKFFCFDGIPQFMYVSKDKAHQPYTDFFSMDGTHLPIYARDPNAEIPPKLPSQFGKMTDIAKNLSKGHKHLRVDFYEIGSSVYVGEMTFYHNSGFSEFHPHEWNVKIGDMINI